MAIDTRLAMKGGREPTRGLAQQGRVSVGLARAHEADLVLFGWPKADTDALEANVAALEVRAAQRKDERSGARGATSTERAALDAAKVFKRRLAGALPRATRQTKTGVTQADFVAGATIGRSTSKMSDWLSKVRPAVARLDAELAPFFGGKVASAELDAVKAALDGADTTQELAVAALPEQTQQVYELQGRVLEAIEDLNRAGRTAFEGQAEVAAKFNKDILLRARKAAGGGEEPEEPEGGPDPEKKPT